jgi:hypothetical protein
LSFGLGGSTATPSLLHSFLDVLPRHLQNKLSRSSILVIGINFNQLTPWYLD